MICVSGRQVVSLYAWGRERERKCLREKERSEEEDYFSRGFRQCEKALHCSQLGLDGLIDGKSNTERMKERKRKKGEELLRN